MTRCYIMVYGEPANVLGIWAALGLTRRPRITPAARWDAALRMVEAARTSLSVVADHLHQLLQQSSQRLAPLEDPLQVDLGMHRWLAKEREEAYSDWLEWVLVQVGRPDQVFQLFGLKPHDDWQNWGDKLPEVRREVPVSEGHFGHTGRLDIVVDYPTHARLIIEVKKTGADDADTAKGAGYKRSQDPSCKFVLLATGGVRTHYEGEFPLRSWADLCVELRRLAPQLRVRLPLITLAMILGFVGAVEQNLLGISANLVNRIINHQLGLLNASVVDYLERIGSGDKSGK